MGRKRKGHSAFRGAISKKLKITKKKVENEAEEEMGLFAIKMAATTAIRPHNHDIVVPWITKISIVATKICELASLLFLTKVREYDEVLTQTGNSEFFDGDGMHIVENCFSHVLLKNKDEAWMAPWFREFVDQELNGEVQWPKNNYFGNYTKYLTKQYARNVKTNLTTHAGKRLLEYMKLIAFYENYRHLLRRIDGEVDNGFIEFDEYDAKNAVNWAIRQYDSTQGDPDRLRKQRELLSYVHHGRENIAQFTENKWLASLPMWLHMQKMIDDYHQWYEKYSEFFKPLINVPQLKNLAVIPICSHMRKSVDIDSDMLYRMMCETKTITRDENGIQHTAGFVCQHKEHYFNQIFNMEYINKVLKANKRFHYLVRSDGVSISILYEVPKNTLEQLENDELVRKRYDDGLYVYELGIDPGMKTWNATVRRHIDSGKEVRYEYDSIVSFNLLSLFNAFHCVSCD